MNVSALFTLSRRRVEAGHLTTRQRTRLKFKWIGSLIMLFVLTQTAGLLHAEIHPFHEHTASCDIFDNMAQPVDASVAKTPLVSKAPAFTAYSVWSAPTGKSQAFRQIGRAHV